MKTSSPVYQGILMFVCAVGMGMLSCNQPSKPATADAVQTTTLTKVDKGTLLLIVTDLAKTIQDKNYSTVTGKTLLQKYSSIYKIRLNGKPGAEADSAEYLNVFVNDDGKAEKPKLLAFRFYLPQTLGSELTFADLKKNYGNWIVSPAAEQDTTVSTMFQFKETPAVTISAESKKMPDAAGNSIEQLTVMR
jgi:hypothetical protein